MLTWSRWRSEHGAYDPAPELNRRMLHSRNTPGEAAPARPADADDGAAKENDRSIECAAGDPGREPIRASGRCHLNSRRRTPRLAVAGRASGIGKGAARGRHELPVVAIPMERQ